EEISRLFGEHGITTALAEEITHDSMNMAGLKVLAADPSNPSDNDNRTMAFLDAAGVKYEVKRTRTEYPEITVLLVCKAFSD
ncbi:MAG: hypothetical protein ACREQ4_11540, partial [Candidatus Binataceae bacterium]